MSSDSYAVLGTSILICVILIVSGIQLLRGHWLALLSGSSRNRDEDSLKRAKSLGRSFLVIGVIALVALLVNTFVLHRPIW
ncbi:hypothetical protein ACFQ5M_04285 [Agrilactobacillus yilanensis]|uniref:Uncharacterized protein n=1 Tax=Agrilactobacillus yilanensis TaxID=2485997 RepID=A0ABW4J5V7_9LACO|nr:hypothetical protein [Agrilactobacillus yilanensis]